MIRRNLFHSFSFKLFVCIFSTAFLLLLAGLFILCHLSVKATTDINNQMLTKTLSITTSNLENTLSECDQTAQLALAQEDILQKLKKPIPYPSETFNTVKHALVTAVSANSSVSDILICDSWDNMVSSSMPFITYPYRSREDCLEWLGSFSESHSNISQSWYYLVPDPVQSDRYCFANVRDISLLGTSLRPLMVIFVSENRICAAYDFLGEDSFIMSASGRIISAVDKERIGTQASAVLLDEITPKNDGFVSAEAGQHYYVAYLSSIDGYLVVNSTTDALRATNSVMLVGAVLIILFGLLFSIVWADYISGSITKPLMETKACIERVRSGDMDIRCNIRQQDEIGYLSESFNHMMDTLEEQIRQRNEQQNLAKENELRLLQSQINPHLLYNSLDSALYLMTMNNTDRSIEILEQLSRFFKLSLQRGSKLVSIGSVIEHIDIYLKLQNLCRMKHFRLNVVGDPALLRAQILHMLVQPVVENCVLHGFDGSFSDGLIEISLDSQGDDILIRVTDDGMGIEEQALQQLCDRLKAKNPPAESFGLWNVNQRLQMQYGKQYTLQIESEFGEYTSVYLRIPKYFPERDGEDLNV